MLNIFITLKQRIDFFIIFLSRTRRIRDFTFLKNWKTLSSFKRFMGEDQYKVALQQQHKAFSLVHIHMKESNREQKEYADSKDENIQIGDRLYQKNHRRTHKLDIKWCPLFRLVDQVTYWCSCVEANWMVKVAAKYKPVNQGVIFPDLIDWFVFSRYRW